MINRREIAVTVDECRNLMDDNHPDFDLIDIEEAHRGDFISTYYTFVEKSSGDHFSLKVMTYPREELFELPLVQVERNYQSGLRWTMTV